MQFLLINVIVQIQKTGKIKLQDVKNSQNSRNQNTLFTVDQVKKTLVRLMATSTVEIEFGRSKDGRFAMKTVFITIWLLPVQLSLVPVTVKMVKLQVKKALVRLTATITVKRVIPDSLKSRKRVLLIALRLSAFVAIAVLI